MEQLKRQIKSKDPIITEEFIEDTITRIKALGIDYCDDEDAKAYRIAKAIDKGILDLLTFTNQPRVPEELANSLIEYIAITFLDIEELLTRITAGTEEMTKPQVESITEGDTQVNFGQNNADIIAKNQLVKQTTDDCKKQWLHYRKIKWH